MSDITGPTPAAEQPPAPAAATSAPPPVVDPAPTAAEAFPDHLIQGIVGSGGISESHIVHYRSESSESDAVRLRDTDE